MPDPSDTAIDTANQLHRNALRLLRLPRGTRSTEGLSLSKLAVLGHLYREGAATATLLAAYLRVQPQSLTRLIGDLDRRKLITRRPNEADRRQNLLEITDKGVQLLTEEVQGQRTKLAQTIAEKLTPTEQEVLRLACGLLDSLAAAIEAQTAESGKEKERGETGEVSS